VNLFEILVWSASIGIPVSYVLQIISNYKHKETRDINLYGVIFANYAYLIYGIKSGMLSETAFIIKYGLSFAFCSAMIIQIIIYRRKKYEWHDDIDTYCVGKVKDKIICGNELEPHWKFCTDCGLEVK